MAVPIAMAISAAAEVANTLSPAMNKKIKAAAQQFEGIFLTNMFEEMFANVEDADQTAAAGQSQSAWRSLLTEEYANTVSRSGGIGLADHIQRELIALQERNR